MEKSKPPQLLIVDDDPDDQYLIKAAINQTGKIIEVNCEYTGQAAINYLQSCLRDTRRLPALILMDLNMPGLDGKLTLRQIKQHNALSHIPVIVYTTSTCDQDIQEAYQAGANAYMSKPQDYEGINNSIRDLIIYWLQHVKLPG